MMQGVPGPTEPYWWFPPGDYGICR